MDVQRGLGQIGIQPRDCGAKICFTATSALLGGDSITVGVPTGFSLPSAPTIALTGGGYASCAATGAASGTSLTVTLSGSSCVLTAGTRSVVP